MASVVFRDRVDGGRRLAETLGHLRDVDDLVVLGLPRGGVVVAAEVARELSAPLDVLVVRKLGFPGHEELALGAVASGGAIVLNDDVLAAAGLDEAELQRRAEGRQQAVIEMEARLRGDRPALDLGGRTAVLVDDGLATGATMRVAVVAAPAGRAPIASWWPRRWRRPRRCGRSKAWPTRWSASPCRPTSERWACTIATSRPWRRTTSAGC